MCLQRRRCARPRAPPHAEAWQETFALLSSTIDRTGSSFAPFSVQADYDLYVHGRTRHDAIREFLASRGVSLPEGSADEGPGVGTVNALARYKSEALRRLLDVRGVKAYQGARLFLELAHEAGIRCAVVSGSTTMTYLLERAGLSDWSTKAWTGRRCARRGCIGSRPRHAARRRAPARRPARGTAVFETSADGVVAGRAGGFDLVVAVDHGGQANALVSGRGPGGVGPRRDPRAIARRVTPRRTRLFEVTFRSSRGRERATPATPAAELTARPDRARSGAGSTRTAGARRPRVEERASGRTPLLSTSPTRRPPPV